MKTIQTEVGAQMQWHKKPNSGLCVVCGCGGALRKGVMHRAYTASEAATYRAPYVKMISVAFGQDFEQVQIGWDGKVLPPPKDHVRTEYVA
jgi:PHP family Zn ribbon phosphoesterase